MFCTLARKSKPSLTGAAASSSDSRGAVASQETRSLGGSNGPSGGDSTSLVQNKTAGAQAQSEPPHASCQDHDSAAVMIRQPKTRSISQDELVTEVKAIYSGLFMVEEKCIQVVDTQMKSSESLSQDQWQALVSIHRTALHEYHDFFLASQHPSASPALKRLATKYSMASRMWRHGIHSFLELLRLRLPESMDFMLTFLYLAYSMVSVLYESVPAFENILMESLGDLARYRMAIEDNDMAEREVWGATSMHWYFKKLQVTPDVGRLCHHLAVLSQPNILHEMFYYSKSLCLRNPFKSTTDSIKTLFAAMLNSGSRRLKGTALVDVYFVKLMAGLFTREGTHAHQLDSSISGFLGLLDESISRAGISWQSKGYLIAIVQSCAVLDFGLDQGDDNRRSENPLYKAMLENDTDAEIGQTLSPFHRKSCEHFSSTLDIVSRRIDPNTLSFCHAALVLLYRLSMFPKAAQPILALVNWEGIASLLNWILLERPEQDVALLMPEGVEGGDHRNLRPKELAMFKNKKTSRRLPEDNSLRGLPFAENYHPSSFFEAEVDIQDALMEEPWMVEVRKDRVLGLGCCLATSIRYLRYDEARRRFHSSPGYDRIAGSQEPSSPTVSAFSSGIATPATQDEEMEDASWSDCGKMSP
ncbi:hypothetical protein MKZ38_008055 [Zalerion maritima]|uniref:DNA/RNA-binding domain-containing protein n=1 Tax=Zalerion maritima TaxID=339359 RepID=A0AAD5WMN5_9PEZI|nr:hypothetical protein MKZ38_008055 [Zalerion maritima]